MNNGQAMPAAALTIARTNSTTHSVARWGALLTSLVNGWGGETAHETAQRARATLRYVEFDEEVRAGGSGQLLREDWGGWAKMTQDGDPKLQAEGRALEEKGRMASIRRFGLSKPLYVKVG